MIAVRHDIVVETLRPEAVLKLVVVGIASVLGGVPALGEVALPGVMNASLEQSLKGRVLLEEFNGRAAGDTMDFDDGEIELLGCDAQESYWACQKAHMYLWIPAYSFR